MLLCEHVYCVAVTFKMTERMEPEICISFWVKLEHSLWKLFGWFRRPQLWATGDWQLHHDNAPAHASHLVHSFLVKHQITQVTQPLLPQPRFGTLQLLAFPKIKITFEREEIADLWWDSGKYDRAADGNWENCVRSQDAYSEGDWGVIVLCTMFLVYCIFFSKCFYFSYHMAEYLLHRPHVFPFSYVYTY